MATDALSYTGINRAVSDYAGAKACEELINLRPATEGTVPVKDFSVKLADMGYRKVFMHYTTDGPHYIVIVRGGEDNDSVLVQYVDGNGVVKQTLLNTPFLSGTTIESIHIAFAGNVILISLCDTDNSDYANAAYTWKADEDGTKKYIAMEANAPEVSFSVSDEVDMAQTDIIGLGVSSAREEVVSAVESGINAIQENNLNLCVGPILIAVAFKTNDGNTFWTGKWTIYDPIPSINADDRFYLNANSSWFLNQVYRDLGYYAKYDHAYSLVPLTDGGTQGGYAVGSLDTITVPGTKVTITFPAISGWDENTSIIQSLEVYASRPQVFIDSENAADGFFFNGNIVQASLIVPQKKYEDMDLGGQLLYHQASIPMASLAEADQEVKLSFGGNIQVSEDTLDADAGALKRYGRLLSYNARFHYWDSVAHIDIGMPSFLTTEGVDSGITHVFVQYADEDQSGLVWVGRLNNRRIGRAYTVIAPSLNIKEIVTYEKISGTYCIRKYRMQASSTYNYSICVGAPYSDSDYFSGTYEDYDDLIPSDLEPKGITREEPDAINVTEQYNPFVFRVEHSYLAPGNILDIQPQMAGMADASYGRDPLTVFTERGTYALTQGSANVLYGAFLPVSNNVISTKGGGSALPTEMGTFYLGDGCLWLIAGRRSTLISDALHLGPHKYIRSCPGYQRISGGGLATPEYDVSALVSQVTFEEFVNGTVSGTKARLSFNRFRMELLISNPSYPYTYVLSLKYRQWFKIGKRVWQDQAGSDIAITPGSASGLINIVDLSTEVTAQVLVHMQTRPFSMAYGYIHMHRIVSLVRAKLAAANGDKLVVGLYGSEDLQDWHLLAYSKRDGGTGTLQVSQIRTAPSARSWRYYTVCIGGPVQPDADFGPILVDYEPVIRRIG